MAILQAPSCQYSRIRDSVYKSDKQGVDCFEESSSFAFAKNMVGWKNRILNGFETILI